MLLHKFNDDLGVSHIETNVYLSEDFQQVVISQCLSRSGEVLSFNEVSVPITDFARSATSVSRTYVTHFLDKYKLDDEKL
jgi:hypothetical protein